MKGVRRFWLWMAVKLSCLICLFSWVWYEPNPVIYWAEYVMTVWGVVVGALLIAECVRECTKR